MKKYIVELIGTFWLVLGGCGSAVVAAAFTSSANTIGSGVKFPLGGGLLGVSLAFGLTIITIAYSIGQISGCHLNPAVSFGLWAGKKFPARDLLPYILAQVLGAIIAGGLIYLIAIGNPEYSLSGSNPLGTNGYGTHSPGGYPLFSCLIAEIIFTFMFVMIILGATNSRETSNLAPIVIGLALVLIHLVTIPITNTSVNPARSTGVAIWAGTELISQLWLFWVAPIVGGLLAGWTYRALFDEEKSDRRKEVLEDARVAPR